ncbi:unnamed protein product [Thelazia callipaeda]|uniref:Uncharacterized protein n=1 Tax=Thelazia callipaeda TaxID=103827 RepID=A0A158RCC3_THECL|nr:unnamed protein product [Thelazia callipaeda]
MTISQSWMYNAALGLFLPIWSLVLYIALILNVSMQCSNKKKLRADQKEKNAKLKGTDGARSLLKVGGGNKIAQITGKEQKKLSKEELEAAEKERIKEAEEKRIEEIKPKIMKRNAKEERIARGKETRGKGDYPTMDDVLSDWDSEQDAKKDTTDHISKVTTNLDDVEEVKKDETINKDKDQDQDKDKDKDHDKDQDHDKNKDHDKDRDYDKDKDSEREKTKDNHTVNKGNGVRKNNIAKKNEAANKKAAKRTDAKGITKTRDGNDDRKLDETAGSGWPSSIFGYMLQMSIANV